MSLTKPFLFFFAFFTSYIMDKNPERRSNMKTVLEDMDIFEMGGLLNLYYGKVDYKTFIRMSRRMNKKINRKQKNSRKEN